MCLGVFITFEDISPCSGFAVGQLHLGLVALDPTLSVDHVERNKLFRPKQRVVLVNNF